MKNPTILNKKYGLAKKLAILLMILLLSCGCYVSCQDTEVTNESVSETTNESVSETTDESVSETTDESSVESETGSTGSVEAVPPIGAFLVNIQAFQYGKSESGDLSVNHRLSYDYSDTFYKETNANSKITTVISGKEYELSYEETVDGPLYRDTVRKYRGDKVTLWFDLSTGECVYYFGPSESGLEEDQCTIEQQMEIAMSFLNSQVTDPENYQITKQERTTSGVLYVFLTRMVGELATNDQIIVKVDQSGAIPLYRLINVGEMRDVPPIPDSVFEKIEDVLDSEATRIYGTLTNQGYQWSYKTQIDRLVRLDDCSLALECYVSAMITAPDGTVLSDGAWFIIPITESSAQAD